MKYIIYFILLIFSPADTLAQFKWEQTNGPFGGFVTGMFYDNGIFYFSTENGVYRSPDEGESYEKLGLQGIYLTVIAVDNKYIYAGTYLPVLYRRDKFDNVSDWEQIDISFVGNIRKIEIHPAGFVFIKTENQKLFRSGDEGLTWKMMGSSQNKVESFLITAAGDIYTDFYPSGVHKSSDYGETWFRKSRGLPVNNVQSFMEDDNGNLYAGSEGVYKSTNGGDSWYFTGLAGHMSFLYQGPGGYMFAGNTGKFFRSNDGINWRPVGSEIRGLFGMAGAQNPQGVLYLSSVSGFYKSINYGEDFLLIGLPIEQVGGIAMTNQDKIYAGGGRFTFISYDYGKKWHRMYGVPNSPVVSMITTTENSILAGHYIDGICRLNNWSGCYLYNKKNRDIVQAPDGTIYAVDEDTLFKSSDDGQSWSKSSYYSFDEILSTAAPHKNGIFLGTLGAGVYFSADSGMNWNQLNNGLQNLNIRHLLSDGKERLFAASDRGVYLYTNENWIDISGILSERRINRLLILRDELYAASDSGIYKKNYNDADWLPVNEGLNDMNVISIAVANNGYLFAGTLFGYVYRGGPALVSSVENEEMYPDEFKLYQNYPNPFNPSTKIRYELPGEGPMHVSIRIYNVLGALVHNLVDEEKSPGIYEAEFDGGNLPSGVYFYSLQTAPERYAETKKLLLMK